MRIVAVPSMAPGGLEASRSGHFGHCDCFTLLYLADGEVERVQVIENLPHEEGGCLGPVGVIADHAAGEIVVAGMGVRPLLGFAQAGIRVLYEDRSPRVCDLIPALLDESLAVMSPDMTCGGGECAHH
jgi:predicted Fe-Mo cluster-binding NifX family protein